MTHKFEEYPELADMMQEYAAFGKFGDWQKFTDVLNNALTKAENLPIHNVSGSVCKCKVNRMIVRHEDKDWCNSCGELVKAN